jgi:PAS domain S-box-containing protein
MKFLLYLNPIARLGTKQYSVVFPATVTLICIALLEIWAYGVVRDPNAVGLLAIAIFVILIIYFSFRDGIRGGLTTAALTIIYYFYIIYSRRYTGEQLTSGVITTLILGFVYFSLSGIIGWLRQTIDSLIEREANEKRRFLAIMQQLPVGVIVTDNKGTIEFANKNAEVILGTKIPLGFTVGNKFFVKVLESKPSPPSQSILAKTLSLGKPITHEEFVIEKRYGKKAYIEANASPIRNSRGEIIAAAEILSDVTPQKELELRKDDFINMASHELKTPLTSMKLYLTVLKKQLANHTEAKSQKILASIIYQTDRLQDLVSDLLDVSRLETGKLSFTKELLPIDTLIKDTIEELQSSIDGKTINFTSSGSLQVHADKFRLYQVLTNLITNAAKYSPNKGTIIVQLKKQKDAAVVSVQDFGIGIAKEDQKKIFDRLYQASSATVKTYPGLGMGLYISREIIKRHKGRIWVESSLGKGSTFYFSLPLHTKQSQ